MQTACFFFKSIPWKKIREGIKEDLRTRKINILSFDLNEYISQLFALVTNFLQKLVPKAKPCFYSKRL